VVKMSSLDSLCGRYIYLKRPVLLLLWVGALLSVVEGRAGSRICRNSKGYSISHNFMLRMYRITTNEVQLSSFQQESELVRVRKE
jgi:hypothetical protein